MHEILNRLELKPSMFSGKVALVAGGARGIGATAVKFLASLGAKVILADISLRGHEVVAELLANGGEAAYVQTDLAVPESIDDLVTTSLKRYGQIDIFLNTAACITVETLANFTVANWDRSYHTNVRGPTYLLSRLLPGMLARKSGVIMAISSIEGVPFVSSYSAQKMALQSMLISLSRELPADCGVSCVTMVPGSVDTPLVHEATTAIADALGAPVEAVLSGMKNNPGYDGLIPVEHSAASCLYFIAHAAAYHGQLVDGYLPLHEHGVIDIHRGPAHPESSSPTDPVLMPDPAVELAPLVKTNLDIEQRVKSRTAALEKEKDRLHNKSTTDALTGLPNRVGFDEMLAQALHESARHGKRLALLFIDLDEFKPVNDRYGHRIGDLLLQEAAKRMQQRLRCADFIARLGGDEFVALLSDIEGEHVASSVAEKIRAVLDQPFLLEGKAVRISSSIGVALYPDHGSDSKSLLENADAAMYEAKGNGRNAIQFCSVAA